MSQNELEDPIEENIMKENENEDKEKEDKEEEKEDNRSVVLQLGDVIRLEAPSDELLNNITFIIDYIDASLVKLVNIKDFNIVPLKIHEDGILGDGSIAGITLIFRNENQGYARQNNLLPGTWINLYFGGDIPAIITGKITNLEEDMIEIKTYPDNDTIYLNFGYKGLPLDIPIENIEIREEPQKEVEKEKGVELEKEKGVEKEKEVEVEKEKELEKELEKEVKKRDGQELEEGEIEEEDPDQDINIPFVDVKDQVRQFIIRANEIQFGEELGPIVQYEDVDPSKKRFDVEVQANDLLDELLSTIPSIQRTTSVLNNIHIMIERFKQLRLEFSNVDQYGNILSPIKKGVDWKPLQNDLLKFKTVLAWLLPVAKNVKKIYNVNPSENNEYQDIIALNTSEDIKDMRNVINNYTSNDIPDEQNKYVTLMTDLNPFFTPFEGPNPEFLSDIIYENEVESNISAIIDNLTEFESTVINNDFIKTNKFLIQKYNLGLDRLEVEQMTGSKMITKRVVLTRPDTLALKSIITLPEPVIRYSRISMPTTNIMEKSNLNLTSLNYWQLLNSKTNVKNIIVDSLDENLQIDEDKFVNNIKNYILSAGPEHNSLELYTKFLKTIIPKTRVLFNMIKKYIHGKLSLVDVVDTLSPFLIYINDITFKQYEEINKFIVERITLYNKRFVERSRNFSLLKKRVGFDSHPPSNTKVTNLLYETDKNVSKDVFDKYLIKPTSSESGIRAFNGADSFSSLNRTNSETILMMTNEDCSRLYDSAMSLENLNLMIPEDIGHFMDDRSELLKSKIEKGKEASTCLTYVLAKQYESTDELEADNDKEIYFDKKFDNTVYSMLDEYQKERMVKTPEEFKEFLLEKLLKKHGVLPQNIESMAETLINGVKRVENGQYAIINDTKNNTEMLNMFYFKRANNRWEQDTSITPDMMADNESFLCNFQENCIEVTKKYDAICEPMNVNKKTVTQNALKEMINQFDKTYQVSKEQLQKILEEKFLYYFYTWDKMKDIEINNKFKYNLQQVRIGVKAEEEEMEQIVSPYKNLRDIVLGQSDFVKKQWDIVRFAVKYTREAIRSASEDEHWRYCIKTNTKLLPIFLYELAGVWCEDPDNYLKKMDFVIKQQGAASDDGDSWVDKYSGYVIKQIDFDIDEGYEEGYRVNTRAQLEKDAGAAILSASQKPVQIDTPLTKMIHNIINSVGGFMGIQLESQKEFIVKVANSAIKSSLPSEDAYKTKIEEMAKKGKAISSYKDVYNLTVLYNTLGALLIGIQTSIPSVRTRKTFPGCVRSFDGYPFQGSGDFSALRYLSCVVYKIRNKVEPWSALTKTKEDSIFDKLKTFIDSYLLSNEDVVRKMQEKTEYILTNPPEIIPKEHELSTWLEFLPPLVRFTLKPFPQNISPAFKKTLMQDFKSGARAQREKVLVIESKIIQFSLAIQERIQRILDKKKLLLTNAVNEPFLENACCNEKERRGLTAIQYFEKEDNEIKLCNNIVEELSRLLYDIQAVSKGPFFFCRENTKIQYPPLMNDFNEDTIYQAFIVLCKFNSAVPITPDLLAVCTDKPDYLNLSDSISEKIRKLKEDGRKYTNESMTRLLQIVNRNNMVTVQLDSPAITLIQKLRDVLKDIAHTKDELIHKKLLERLEASLDTFDIGVKEDSEEMRSLKNYLSDSNKTMRTELLEFLETNGGLTKKRLKEIKIFIEKISDWEASSTWRNKETTISDDAKYNSLQFMKEYMQNILKTFPTIILNKVDYQNIQLPKYWGLSVRHMEDVKEMIMEYYNKLRVFYDDKVMKNVLQVISEKCKRLLMLAEETPYLSEITFKGESMHSIFDTRTTTLLMENYLIQALVEYTKLAEDPKMIIKKVDYSEQEQDEYLLTVEEIEEREQRLSEPIDPSILLGEKKQLGKKVAELLIAFLTIMEDHKDMIDFSYERVMDLVFKTKEREKDTFTDRLEALTDEERDADTILKINKLGVWNKGLQKGLTKYVKETYDEERDYMEKLGEIEKQVKRNKNVTDSNLEQYMEDYLEDAETANDIDREENNMNGLTEDYMDGDYFGQEEENFGDFD